MVRSILGVIVGFVVMAMVVMISFAVAFAVMTGDKAFKPGTWEVTTQWLVMAIVMGLVAAIIGGLVCALVARRGSRAWFALVIVVLLIGSGEAAYTMREYSKSEAPTVRTGQETMQEAAMNARQPVWILWLNPVVGAIGVTIGGRLRGGKASSTSD